MFRKLSACLAFVLLLSLLGSCVSMPQGISGEQPAQSGAPDTAGSPGAAGNTATCAVKDGVAALDEQGRQDWSQSVISEEPASGGRSRFVIKSGNAVAAGAKAGDVIVLDGSITGRALKVVSRTEDGQGNVVLDTVSPALTDVFDEIDLDVQKQLTPSDIRWSSFAQGCALRAEGGAVSLSGGNGLISDAAYSAPEGSNRFVIDVPDVVLYDADGDEETTDDQIVADGAFGVEDLVVTAQARYKSNDLKGLDVFSVDVQYKKVAKLDIKYETSKDSPISTKGMGPDVDKVGNDFLAVKGVDISDKFVIGTVAFDLATMTPDASAGWIKKPIAVGCLVYFSISLDGSITASVTLGTELFEYDSWGVRLQRVGFINTDEEPFNPENYNYRQKVYNDKYWLCAYTKKLYSKEEPDRPPETVVSLTGNVSGEAKLMMDINAGLLIFGVVPLNVSYGGGLGASGSADMKLNFTFPQGQPVRTDLTVDGSFKLEWLQGITAEAAMKVIVGGEDGAEFGWEYLNEKITPTVIYEYKSEGGDAVCNAYTASDGQYVYYMTGEGVNRMGLDGSGDHTVLEGRVYEFAGVSDRGLYYLVYNRNYSPKGEENEWQWCNAYDLMRLDPNGGEPELIAGQLYQCQAAPGGILYLIDHNNHYNVTAYNVNDGTGSAVSGVSPSIGGENSIGITFEGGQPFLMARKGEQLMEYPIAGGKLGDPKAYAFDPNASAYQTYTAGDVTLRRDFSKGNVSVESGGVYKDLGLSDVDSVCVSGSDAYVLTMAYGAENSDYTVNVQLALYRVKPGGELAKVFEGPSYTSYDEGMNAFEVAGGWGFFYWVNGDGGTASILKIKQTLNQ